MEKWKREKAFNESYKFYSEKNLGRERIRGEMIKMKESAGLKLPPFEVA